MLFCKFLWYLSQTIIFSSTLVQVFSSSPHPHHSARICSILCIKYNERGVSTRHWKYPFLQHSNHSNNLQTKHIPMFCAKTAGELQLPTNIIISFLAERKPQSYTKSIHLILQESSGKSSALWVVALKAPSKSNGTVYGCLTFNQWWAFFWPILSTLFPHQNWISNK